MAAQSLHGKDIMVHSPPDAPTHSVYGKELEKILGMRRAALADPMPFMLSGNLYTDFERRRNAASLMRQFAYYVLDTTEVPAAKSDARNAELLNTASRNDEDRACAERETPVLKPRRSFWRSVLAPDSDKISR